MENIIQIKNLGKRYNINRPKGGYIALRDVLTNIFKNPFKFAGDKAKQITGRGTKEEFWALKNIDIEIKKGEVVGIIGSNGAGKSTLLKILSQITPPTTGEIIINGRVGSLLEVGTGFHPELTGRENIYLNSAILGMNRKEIDKKFDQIVEFAGTEKFLDTPVKYYSSGMYVRLAFAVAAHLDPDILIIDEVLAVGDSEFQKKCLGKMDEISKTEGRTILFVSHNMAAIKKLCGRCVLLKNGEVIKNGETNEVIDFYLNNQQNLNSVTTFPFKNKPNAQITKVSILNKDGVPSVQNPISENFFIEVEYDVYQPIKKKLLFLHFFLQGDLFLISSDGDKNGEYRDYEKGKYKTRISLPKFLFQVGSVYFNVIFNHPSDGANSIDMVQNLNFEITNKNNPKSKIFNDNYFDKLGVILDFKTEKIE